ncbi:MAG: Hsp33 family molecular chaperone HslO [Desulfopila sp.]
MPDILYRSIANSGNLFALACDTTDLVNEACRKHDAGPTAAAALGRALTGAVLLAALLKEEQHLQLKFEGNGPLGKIITEAGHQGWARGYVANPLAEVPLRNGAVDVAAGLGSAGFLTVTKDIGGKHSYQGTVQLRTSEIGEDIAGYLLESEQIPSVVALGVVLQPDGSVPAAGGYLIQALPPVDEALLDTLERQLHQLPPLTRQLMEGRSPADILADILRDIDHHSTGSRPLSYQCSCNRLKMERAVVSLGQAEVQNLLELEGGIEVQCEFCRDSYRFNRDELAQLFPAATR